MADQLIMYPIVVGMFAYLTFSLFYIRAKYSRKRARKSLDAVKEAKLIGWLNQGSIDDVEISLDISGFKI